MPRFARCVFAVFLAVSCLSSSLTCQAAVPETAAAETDEQEQYSLEEVRLLLKLLQKKTI